MHQEGKCHSFIHQIFKCLVWLVSACLIMHTHSPALREPTVKGEWQAGPSTGHHGDVGLEFCAGQHGSSKEGDFSPSRGGVEARGHFLKVARPNPGPSRVPAKEDSTINNRT